MKIIGTTGSGFIVECDEGELKNVIGKAYCERANFRVGDTIRVDETWRKLKHILGLQAEFNQTCKTLAAMHDLLENVGGGIMERINNPSCVDDWE